MKDLYLRALLWAQSLLMPPLSPPPASLQPSSTINIGRNWQVLGPFQIGTREATWGADPLEYVGGFRNISYSKDAVYRSSLGLNGLVSWETHSAHFVSTEETSEEAVLQLQFQKVDWKFLQSFHGWAALQYQAWARGTFHINRDSPQDIVIYVDGALELWIDGIPYFGGDYYRYRRAPLILHATPGEHLIEVRLVRDVRAMGGIGEPLIDILLKLEVSQGDLVVIPQHAVLPELLDNGKLSSKWASIPLRNEGHKWVEISGIKSLQVGVSTAMVPTSPLRLAPGQTRPLKFRIDHSKGMSNVLSVEISFRYERDEVWQSTTAVTLPMSIRKMLEPHRITFQHPSGIVSYSILKPPSIDEEHINRHLPVLLNLHGAGLEADSDQVRHMMDAVPPLPAWMLFPTGVTTWSGDDWHTWGSGDIFHAIQAIEEWISDHHRSRPGLRSDRWYVCGHSNGGQGTWFLATHYPDHVVAAAPVSGYSSIQSYVSYQFWRSMDPRLEFVVRSSLATYNHDLFMENLADMAVTQQHGRLDDNVPAFESRRLSMIASEAQVNANYTELPDRNHWYDDDGQNPMTTPPLQEFYGKIGSGDATNPCKRAPKSSFVISSVIPSNREVGSKRGIFVDQLIYPDQLGRLEIDEDDPDLGWSLKTSNILRFHFVWEWSARQPSEFVDVDDQRIYWSALGGAQTVWFVKQIDGSWICSQDESWMSLSSRYGRQTGSLAAILRTAGSFLIRAEHANLPVALQVARNFYQYFAADSEIFLHNHVPHNHKGNVISIYSGTEFAPAMSSSAITLSARGLQIRDVNGHYKDYPFQAGLGTIFLRPRPDEALELVIWGYDEEGLRQASRLVPMLTGVGQPDFIVVSRKCAWEGAAGVLAAGYFDSSWNVSPASYLV